jgi:Glyoxalase-like domain
MTIELDHLFIFTRPDAPEVERLVEFGLCEGQPNTHPGQGTACRRIFFHNAYLEFVWVANEQEVTSEWVRPLNFLERSRYRQTNASPFGLIFRPAQDPADQVALPFRTWALHPPYLPAPLKLDVADNSDELSEPLLFYMSFGRRSDRYPRERQQPVEHAFGFKEITGIQITMPGASALSKPLRAVEAAGLARFVNGPAPLAEVIFDAEKQGKTRDFRPELPLVLRW